MIGVEKAFVTLLPLVPDLEIAVELLVGVLAINASGPGGGAADGAVLRVSSGDLNGFRSAALATSTRRRLAAGPGV